MYCSAAVPKIFQDEPLEWRPSSFTLKSWTDTITGYLYEAKKLSMSLWHNRRLMKDDYTWEVTINFEQELPPEDIKAHWTKIVRKLREQGIDALWVREPSRDNRCHHHLLLKNQITETELRRIVKNSLPSRSELPTHTHIERIRNQWNYVWYITKAKISSVVDGREVKDKHKYKRLLFSPKLGLRKVGTIGTFWVKPRAAIWQDIKDHEQKIADGLEQPLIHQLCDHVYEICGGAVSRKRIERSFGYSADTEAIRDWADKVDRGEQQWPVDNEQLAGEATSETGLQREFPRSFMSKVCSAVWPVVATIWGTALAWCWSLRKHRPDPLSLHPP